MLLGESGHRCGDVPPLLPALTPRAAGIRLPGGGQRQCPFVVAATPLTAGRMQASMNYRLEKPPPKISGRRGQPVQGPQRFLHNIGRQVRTTEDPRCPSMHAREVGLDRPLERRS